jgi:N-methylhydantoinase B
MVDPITVEVIRAAMSAAAEEMKICMLKTTYSPILNEARDFGCAMFDSDVNMIAEAVGLPLFQGHLGWPVLAAIRDRGWDDIHPGDIFIHNDPYDGGGNHLNDVVMFAPFFADGTPLGFVVVKAHWVDVGGSVPGSMAVDTTEFYQEGLRLQSLKLFQGDKENRDVWRVLTANIRTATGVMRDIKAMIATCRVGLRRVEEIIARYGRETLRESWRMMMNQSERRTRKAIAAIPDGTYQAEGLLDNDGIELKKPLRIAVTITIKGDDFHVDLSECEPQVKGPFNCGDAITMSACRFVLKCLTTPHDPVDEGCFRPLQVNLPPGLIVSAQPPAPVARYFVPLLLLIELMFRALGSVLREKVPAANYGDHMPTIIYGLRPDTGQPFIHADLNAGGNGARTDADGESALIIMAASAVRNTPIEISETKYPFVLYQHYGLRQDSGGAGAYRGGLGISREWYYFTDVAGTFTLERSLTPPWGLADGKSGMTNQVLIADPEGQTRSVRKGTRVPIGSGSLVSIHTGGGGGYGDPFARPVELVQADVKDGYISLVSAREQYGVVLDSETLVVDESQTTMLRHARRAA